MQVFQIARDCFLLLLSPLVAASTYVVDDDGGPGVDFTTIVDAVAAAGPGDVILVRHGIYAGFTLSYGASVLGDPGAVVTSAVRLGGLAPVPRASLAGFSLRTLLIEDCLASITIEDSLVEPSDPDLAGTQGMIAIARSRDVRLRGVTVRYLGSTFEAEPAVYALESRVEIVDSMLEGSDGISCGYSYPGVAQPGADAVVGAGGANLHVARSSLFGGSGGDAQAVECQSDQAGDGKAGMRLDAGALALVSGLRGDDIAGGEGGLGSGCDTDGLPGNGIVVDPGAALRISGVTVTGADYFAGCGGSVDDIVGPFTQAVPADPTLSLVGTPHPGSVLNFTLQGDPYDHAWLVLGRQLTVVDLPEVFEDQLLVPLRLYNLGILPGDGRASFVFHVPASWQPGMFLAAQGRTLGALGVVSLTHSLPVAIR